MPFDIEYKNKKCGPFYIMLFKDEYRNPLVQLQRITIFCLISDTKICTLPYNMLSKDEYRETINFCNNCIVPLGFLPLEIRVAFSEESQLRQSRATKAMVHTGCFSVSIIHRTLTRTTGSSTCAQLLMHAIVHGVYRHT